MHISSVYVLDGELSFDAFFRRFEARVHLVPAYRKKLLNVPFSLSHPKWVDDADFNLSNHVIHHPLAEDTPLDEGIDVAVTLNETILDRSRPLWKMIMLSGVPNKTLLLQMTHHAMIDGASGIDLTTILYDLTPDAGEPVPPNEPWQPEVTPNAMELMNEAVQENLSNLASTNPMSLISGGPELMEHMSKATAVMSRFITKPAITAPFNAAPVGPHRQVKWMKKDFSEIREIRRHLGGTINDVVLAVVSEAVSRYLSQKNERVQDQHLRIMCPVNVRTEDQQGALGNQVSAIFPMLPAWPMNCVERLGLVIEETERIKTAEEAQAITALQQTLPEVPPFGMLASQYVGTAFDPTALAARVPLPILPSFGFRPPNLGINFVCTNVPGVQVPQYMCGHEVTDTIGLLVLTGNTGFSVTILSYNKKLFFNFICEPRLLPDLELIIQAAEDVYQELMDSAAEKSQLDTA